MGMVQLSKSVLCSWILRRNKVREQREMSGGIGSYAFYCFICRFNYYMQNSVNGISVKD